MGPQNAAESDRSWNVIERNRLTTRAGRFALLLTACLLGLAGEVATAAEELTGEALYRQKVKPVLMRRCASCHGSLKQKSGLRIDAAQLLRTGGENGPAVVAGDLEKSLLMQVLTGTGDLPKMPPEGEPLSAEEIAHIRSWIQGGAVAADEVVPADPRQHWAFLPPVRPAVPKVDDPAWAHPIDAFVRTGQQALNVTPTALAPRNLLLRRVSLDLTGLPPTREELHAFLNDSSPEAYARAVDRLLASAQYGERWGRHWMDVWRYSDWDGYGAEIRESKPHLWRWRDWIVESLNADRPYDRMIQEMLAGDELSPNDPNTLRATGFLARHWFKFNRHVWLDNAIEHTGKAFLGLTFNCARCHDHMYDPMSQPEYYQLRAVFEPYDVRTDPLPGSLDVEKVGLVRAFDGNPTASTFLFVRGDDKQPLKDKPLSPALPALLTGLEFQPAAVELPAESYYPGAHSYVHDLAREQASLAVTQAEGKRQAALKSLQEAEQRHVQQLAELAASREPKTETGATPVGATAAATDARPTLLADSFDTLAPERWSVLSGAWKAESGAVTQSDPEIEPGEIRSASLFPADLLLEAELKVTGGKMWRSAGITFDLDENEAAATKSANTVYVSAYAGGSKVQISLQRNGASSYPEGAAKAVPITVGQPLLLWIAVRGPVVNVWLDKQPVIAFKLPGARPAQSKLKLWTYSATAEFGSIKVSPLSAETRLVEQIADAGTLEPAVAGLISPETREWQARQTLQRALTEYQFSERAVEIALAGKETVEQRIAADRALYAAPPAADGNALANKALRSERTVALMSAELTVAQAETAVQALTNPLPPVVSGDPAAVKKSLETPALTEAQQKQLQAAEAKKTEAVKARDAAKEALSKVGNETSYTRFTAVYPSASTGRRLALARAITDRRNPLTARVAVNQIWMRHFGQPLVASVFDFGLNGQKPTHPELLDWLAVEFMEHGWSMKHLHRLIVTSRTYQLHSAISPEAQSSRAIDPDNRLLWRAAVRRMEAEVIRDSALQAAGQLDLTLGGPELDHQAGLNIPRRSLYFRSAKEKKMTFTALFDGPNVSECYRRSESIVPQQALAMANSTLVRSQARRLAARLTEAVKSKTEAGAAFPEDAFIVSAFEQILNRPPTEEERKACLEFLTAQTATVQNAGETAFAGAGDAAVPASTDPHQRAREDLCHVLFNHHEFVTIR